MEVASEEAEVEASAVEASVASEEAALEEAELRVVGSFQLFSLELSVWS